MGSFFSFFCSLILAQFLGSHHVQSSSSPLASRLPLLELTGRQSDEKSDHEFAGGAEAVPSATPEAGPVSATTTSTTSQGEDNRLILSKTLPGLHQLMFGAAPMGCLYKEVTEEEARETLEKALAAGITFFDTAPHYGAGLSEERIGRYCGGRGIRISTKCGRHVVEDVARPAAEEAPTSPTGRRVHFQEELCAGVAVADTADPPMHRVGSEDLSVVGAGSCTVDESAGAYHPARVEDLSAYRHAGFLPRPRCVVWDYSRAGIEHQVARSRERLALPASSGETSPLPLRSRSGGRNVLCSVLSFPCKLTRACVKCCCKSRDEPAEPTPEDDNGQRPIEVLRLHDAETEEKFEAARHGNAVEAMVEMRRQNQIKQVSLGCNESAFLLKWIRTMPEGTFDNIMAAGVWNLLDQDGYELFLECQKRGIRVHNVGIFAAGALWGNPTYKYEDIPAEVGERVLKWKELSESFGFRLPQVALQFAFLPTVVEMVAIGMSSPSEVEQNVALFTTDDEGAGTRTTPGGAVEDVARGDSDGSSGTGAGTTTSGSVEFLSRAVIGEYPLDEDRAFFDGRTPENQNRLVPVELWTKAQELGLLRKEIDFSGM